MEINVQRSTFNVQCSTFNVQCSMFNEASAKGQPMKQPQYDLDERLLDYAANIIRLVERLPNTRAGNHVAGQLLRSGTSPLPNHGEAQAAESRNDFVHKFSICLKELRESRRWLRLIARVPLIKPPTEVDSLLGETEALIKIFAASIRTAERNANARSAPETSRRRTIGLARPVER
jgi:four helix bundle protein